MKLCSSLVLQLLNNLTNSKRCSKKRLTQLSTVVKKTHHHSSKFRVIINNIITVRNEVTNVMFSQACVCPQGGGLPQCMLERKHPPRKDASVHAGKEAPPGRMPQCMLGRKHPPRKDASVHAGKEAPPQEG